MGGQDRIFNTLVGNAVKDFRSWIRENSVVSGLLPEVSRLRLPKHPVFTEAKCFTALPSRDRVSAASCQMVEIGPSESISRPRNSSDWRKSYGWLSRIDQLLLIRMGRLRFNRVGHCK